MTTAPVRPVIRWAAAEVVRMHQHEPLVSWQTGRCAHCPPDDDQTRCLLLAWAEATIAGRTVEPPEPRPTPWRLNAGRWRR